MKNNYAYIDGQNFYMGTSKREKEKLKVDLKKFRIYLKDKYRVQKAFYYLGFVKEGSNLESLYEKIQNAGFILVFRQHSSAMISTKKGNVDSDIIFNIMKRLCKKEEFDKLVLVSGDGDYKNLVDFLIEENKLEKIIFPDRKRASSLYKKLGSEYFDSLDSFRNYIE